MDVKFSRMAKIAVLAFVALGAAGCQFQPLYSSNSGTTGPSGVALSQVSVSEVDTREAQQVRNHLIFLLSGGASPVNPSHDVKLRVSSSTTNLAGAIQSRLLARSAILPVPFR